MTIRKVLNDDGKSYHFIFFNDQGIAALMIHVDDFEDLFHVSPKEIQANTRYRIELKIAGVA